MKMENPKEIKRMNYLSFFKDGVADALLQKEFDMNKKSSAYYKKGYEFGQSFNFQYVYIGDEKENQTYYLHTKEEANGR